MTASKAMAWTRANLELLNLSFMASPTEGFELNQQLKRNTDLASIPIVMITSVQRDDEGYPLEELRPVLSKAKYAWL